MLQVVVEAVGPELALDAVAGTAGSAALGAASLDHEAGDDPVEDKTVIVALAGKGYEVVHRCRGNVGIQLKLDFAALFHFNGNDGVVAHHVFILSSEAQPLAAPFHPYYYIKISTDAIQFFLIQGIHISFHGFQG